jgi:hypothetical protein
MEALWREMTCPCRELIWEHGYRVWQLVMAADVIFPPWMTTLTVTPPCRLVPDPVYVPSR